jgi:hypothetical protein
MSRTGSCICGAVRFHITAPVTEVNACHCSMCRKWSGGVFMGLLIPQDGVQIEGQDAMRLYTSSPWAERAFCGTCGSNLFYRVTEEGPMQGDYHIGLGSLDDANGIALTTEYFIDLKPDGFDFAQPTQKLTTAEVEAMFGDVPP